MYESKWLGGNIVGEVLYVVMTLELNQQRKQM